MTFYAGEWYYFIHFPGKFGLSTVTERNQPSVLKKFIFPQSQCKTMLEFWIFLNGVKHFSSKHFRDYIIYTFSMENLFLWVEYFEGKCLENFFLHIYDNTLYYITGTIRWWLAGCKLWWLKEISGRWTVYPSHYTPIKPNFPHNRPQILSVISTPKSLAISEHIYSSEYFKEPRKFPRFFLIIPKKYKWYCSQNSNNVFKHIFCVKRKSNISKWVVYVSAIKASKPMTWDDFREIPQTLCFQSWWTILDFIFLLLFFPLNKVQ